ncbi:MAG: 1-deoxy-D-xylulose-5-phosphate synthase [Candidatus Marinimicrobia bacterium]|nr:1-deoxy-D-xylulose-5-phosphate synthase [Candidatus Neomarinimicrobiota bacterium]
MEISNIDLRDAFFEEVISIAEKDKDVIFLTADMGAFSLERFKKELPAQFVNVGIAEQCLISVAAGLALGGKRVFAYGIAPFATMRCFEQIKVDLCCNNLPVTVVSVGAGYTYGSDGPTHHATYDIAAMRVLPEITILNPSDSTMTSSCARMAYKEDGPKYIRIERGKLPLLYKDEDDIDFSDGLVSLKGGSDLTIVATGIMVHRAFEVRNRLSQHSIDAGIIDLYRIKPVNKELLLGLVSQSKKIVTLEEHSIIGGIGSIVSEILSDAGKSTPLKRIALSDTHCYESGSREWLHSIYELDADSIVETILDCN